MDTLIFYDGGNVNGTIVGISHIANGGSDTEQAGVSGVIVRTGLFVASNNAEITGTAYVIRL